MTEIPWYEAANAELGQQELRGPEHNPRIVGYQEAAAFRPGDDETPWCGFFVAWCLDRAGQGYDRLQAARARSWLTWGRTLPAPVLGCVVVFWRGRPDGSAGHVGFYAGRAANGDLLVLGGNQGDRVSIAPYPADRLLGCRWPEVVPLPGEGRRRPVARTGTGRAALTGLAGVGSAIGTAVTAAGDNADGLLAAATDAAALRLADLVPWLGTVLAMTAAVALAAMLVRKRRLEREKPA